MIPGNARSRSDDIIAVIIPSSSNPGTIVIDSNRYCSAQVIDPGQVPVTLRRFPDHFLHQFHLDVLDLQESLPLACQKMINFLM